MDCITQLQPDKVEIDRAINILVEPNAYVMVQALPSRKLRTIWGEKAEIIREAIAYLGRENSTGVYISLNPVRDGVDRCARNEDILRRRWIFVDIDRDKSEQPGESATEAEKAQVRHVADQVITFLAAHGLLAPIMIDSGNGVQLLWRIDMPNDGASDDLIKGFLNGLNRQFGEQIDKSVSDARRIIRVPGTINAKGAGTPERPHRLAKLLSVPDDALTTMITNEMLRRVIDSEPPVPLLVPTGLPPAPAPTPLAPAIGPGGGMPECDRPGDDLNVRGSWAEILSPHGWHIVREASDKIEWTRPGKDDGCSATTGFCEGKKSGELLYVFSNNAAPFEPNKGYSKFAAYAMLNHKGDFSAAAKTLAARGFGKRPGPHDDDGSIEFEAVDDPDRLARHYLREKRTTDAGDRTLRYWRQEWMAWDGTIYQAIPVDEISADAHRVVKAELDRANELRVAIAKANGAPPPPVEKVTRGLISNDIAAIESMAILPSTFRPPAWLDDNADPSRSLLSFNNGLLDVDRLFAHESNCLRPHSPRWFSASKFPYEYIPTADCPKWRAFLDRNLEGDTERIAIVQEWFGYSLVPDTSQQKFFVAEGEGANGKSVVCAAYGALLGKANCSSVPLEVFGERFQLTQTLGKLANIVPECGEIDRVAEGVLKSFTSGDLMHFDRKYKEPVEASPTARFFLATNNRPRFSDRSRGLWRRMILMPFRVIIAESERIIGMDKSEYWQDELPGILIWSLAGLERLRRAGHFTRSKVCEEAHAEYQLDCNPAREFLLGHYQEAPGQHVRREDILKRYRAWCLDRGYQPLGESRFGAEVYRAFPQVEKRRVGGRGEQVAFYAGLAVIPSEMPMPPSRAGSTPAADSA